jgi:hypothetical protein
LEASKELELTNSVDKVIGVIPSSDVGQDVFKSQGLSKYLFYLYLDGTEKYHIL